MREIGFNFLRFFWVFVEVFWKVLGLFGEFLIFYEGFGVFLLSDCVVHFVSRKNLKKTQKIPKNRFFGGFGFFWVFFGSFWTTQKTQKKPKKPQKNSKQPHWPRKGHQDVSGHQGRLKGHQLKF